MKRMLTPAEARVILRERYADIKAFFQWHGRGWVDVRDLENWLNTNV